MNYSQMTAENVPKSVRITLISQLILLSIALLLESSLFFTTIYQTFAPYVCEMKFNGKEVCMNYDAEEIHRSATNSFLKLLWPVSMTELVLLLAVLALKLVYIITYRWATLIKILSLSLLGLLICLEIWLLTEYDEMHYQYPFDYEIKLYPVIAKLTIGILVILIGVAMWIEDVKTFRFKISNQSCESSQQHQLLSMQ